MNNMMKCKNCGVTIISKSDYKLFCSINCFQKYKYHNDKEWREKVKETNRRIRKKRYNSDEEYRKKSLEYTKKWIKKHPERMRINALKWYHKNAKNKVQDLSKNNKE